jgi:transposase-like protein
MIEIPVKRGKVAVIARNLGVKPSTAARWWKQYQETEEVLYKKSEKNLGRPSNFTGEHEQHI